MLKGYQRRLIMVPTKSSPLFETAYFILRKETEKQETQPGEMLYEANRILEEQSASAKKSPIKKRHLAICFAAGFTLGVLALAAVWIAFAV